MITDEPQLGDAIRGHRIMERLPGSAMVFVAEHQATGMLRVLKMPDSGSYAVDELMARARREAQILATVRDVDAVPDFVDAGQLDDGRLFLLMEHIEGVTLEEALETQAFPPKRIARIVRALAAAITEFHARGVVHRDLAARNIMLCAGDVVRILDFGDAYVRGPSLTHPKDRANMGTPESAQAKAGEWPHPSDDVCALGKRLVEMLGGDGPRRLRDIAERCVAQERADRCTAAQLRDALDSYLRWHGLLAPVAVAAGTAVLVLASWGTSASWLAVAELPPPRRAIAAERPAPAPVETMLPPSPAPTRATDESTSHSPQTSSGNRRRWSPAPSGSAAQNGDETRGIDARFEFEAPIPYVPGGKYHAINRMLNPK